MASVNEKDEFGPDPKIRKFGRHPAKPIYVKLGYTPEPTEILHDLTEFIYKHAKMMEFSTEPPDYWKTIVAAVLSKQSYEH